MTRQNIQIQFNKNRWCPCFTSGILLPSIGTLYHTNTEHKK